MRKSLVCLVKGHVIYTGHTYPEGDSDSHPCIRCGLSVMCEQVHLLQDQGKLHTIGQGDAIEEGSNEAV